ncbi:hypothetical protein Trydic_g19204 [Trypoxylus dichotomus]
MGENKERPHMQRKRITRFGTWNVQGLKTEQMEVFQEIRKAEIDVCVLTETKKEGTGNEIVAEYIYFYSGVQKHSRTKTGVSIAV